MTKTSRTAVRALTVTAALAMASTVFAQYTDGVVKIGVMSDMSSLYSDVGGPGSVAAAKLAVEDFGAAAKGIKVEIVSGGKAVVAKMKEMPTDDPLFGKGVIRADGRKIHDAFLFEVKKPAESKYSGDFYKTRATIPGAEAFRPLKEGGCPLVQG
jgi:hypothetical protein